VCTACTTRQVTLLGLLDLFVAFNCIDHDHLLQRLEHGFCLGDVVLWLIHSFLSDRTQQVAYGGQLSTTRPLLFGVPQGSILGPLLYILYTAEPEHVVTQHGMCLLQYADDSQLYLHVTVSNTSGSAVFCCMCQYRQ